MAKFEHRLNELYNFHRHENAVLCVLMLRGPQTPGELRTRAERMYALEDLEAVHAALNLLMRRAPALVKVLSRQPGTKESRYMHLLGGDAAPSADVAAAVAIPQAVGPVAVRAESVGGTGSRNSRRKWTSYDESWRPCGSNSRRSRNNFSSREGKCPGVRSRD